VEAAIRAVRPAARIGLSVDMAQVKNGNNVVLKTAGHADFTVPHWYVSCPKPGPAIG